jgi:hypothetical protein
MLRPMPSDGDPKGELDYLVATLTVAQSLATDLTSDPLIPRFLRVLKRLPAADRNVILGVLERDATWCRIIEQTADSTGITVRANPYASLYVHVLGAVEAPSEPLRRDIDVIRSGIERFLYLAPLLLEEGVRAQWTVSARELARDAEPELRAAVAALAREVLALLADVDAEGATPAAPVMPPSAPRSAAKRDSVL